MQTEIKNTQIEHISIDKVKPYEKNARFNDKAVDAVAKSIQEYGFKNPIIVDENYIIIAGHTRLKAAQKIKLATVPVIVASDLTPQQVKAFRLADNKTGELADWNFDQLAAEVQELLDSDYDISLLGFNNAELDQIVSKTIEDMDEYFNLRNGGEDVTGGSNELANPFDYLIKEGFTNKTDGNKEYFTVSVTLESMYKQKVETFIKNGGKNKIVDFIISEVERNA